MASTLGLPDTPSSSSSPEDLWAVALERLKGEDREQFDNQEPNILSVLKGVAAETEKGKEKCVKDEWKVFKNKKGVSLRHVLEKISVWVTQLIAIVDFGVSFDASGHAALPWGIIKFLITVGTNDIKVFSNFAEGVEKISGLITRYNVFEKLYLHQDCESTAELSKALKTLYTAMLMYLAKAQIYFKANTLRKFTKGLLDMFNKQYDQLLASISEAQVDKWAKMVDVELQRKMGKDISADFQRLKDKLHELNQPIVQMSDQISVIADIFEQSERKNVFDWMSKVDYRSHHRLAETGILPGSGKWLVEHDQFILWGQSSVSSILSLYGIPGSGKTGLVSTVINNLRTNLGSRKSPIAFFYCHRNENEPERGKPVEILCAILRQLASSKRALPIREPVATEYQARKKKAEDDCSRLEPLTIEECTDLILKLTLESPATIVIDALDECDSGTRYKLFEALSKIVNNSEEVVKVFLSSRGDYDIDLYFKESRHVFIGTNNEQDITQFVETEVERYHSSGLLLYGRTKDKFRRRLIKTLSGGAKGMFQWVVLSLEALYQIKDKEDFERALGNLPPRLEDLYENIYSKIGKPGTHQHDKVVKTFKWLLCAQRLLSIEELIAAVTFDYDTKSGILSGPETDSDSDTESGTDSMNEGDAGPGPLFIQPCRNLVVIDSERHNFRFAHQSVREYLLTLQEYSPVDLHLVATERCLDLYVDVLRPSMPSTRLRQNNILRPYAKIYWPVHYMAVEREIPLELKRKVSRFIMQDQKTSPAYANWASDIRSEYDPNYALSLNESVMVSSCMRLGYRLLSATHSPPTPLSAACAFGFPSFLEQFQGQPSHVWNQPLSWKGGDCNFLHIAAQEGHEEVVSLLLSNGVEVAKRDSYRRTALHWAVRNGHEKVATQLLKKMTPDDVGIIHGDHIGWSSKWGGTELHEAARHGSTSELVQQLLQKMDVESIACSLWVLHPGQNQELAEMILDTGETGAVSFSLLTALHLAASYGNEKMVNQLLKKLDQASIAALDDRQATPLHRAAEIGHEGIVRLLLAKMMVADIERGYSGNITTLYSAAKNGHSAVVELLLDEIGPDNVVAMDAMNDTALHRAATEGHEGVVRLLLEKLDSDDIAQFDLYGYTALHLAAKNGHKEVVRLLLERMDPVDIMALDDAEEAVDGETALNLATENGHESIVKMLREKIGQVEKNS